ncbi:MAG TPA: hypothetical protein VHE61_11530 [Opitutaceae bacterium]|nr:hypothetical protein [Opitutaceae bacterium]
MVAELLGRVLDFEENPASAFQEGGARFRQDGLASEPVEKFVADLTLKIQNLLAKRWLGDIAAL